VISEAATDAVCLVFAQRGQEPLFADAKPSLKGTGVGATVFLWSAEEHLWNQTLPAEWQSRGTCVSRGTKTACQDSLNWSIVNGNVIGGPTLLAYEPIYGGARIQIGRGSLGRSDGAVGAYAAQYVHDYGLIQRGKYGTIDLTKSNEDLAVIWGTPGHGTPASIVAESASYKVEAAFRCTSTDDIADCIASGYGVAFCSNTIWGAQRDGDGMCRPSGSGGHCEAMRGVYVDWKGRRCFARQQSWGEHPTGNPYVRLNGGRLVKLPQGAYGAFEGDVAAALRDGEAWAFSAPKQTWNRPKPSEAA
jgi:hypothetical protein